MDKGFSVFVSNDKIKVESYFDQKTNDSVVTEFSGIHLVIEGVIINKKKLLNGSGEKIFETWLINSYLNIGWRMFKLLEGEFRGVVWDKRSGKILIFTNMTSTQKVFYAKVNDVFFADSSLLRLSKTIKSNGFSLAPDMISLYQLLTFGSLLENRTPIENISKILDSHFIEVDCKNNAVIEKEYFSISETEYYSKGKSNALDDIHDIFSDSVKMEYEKDVEFNTSHLALLSGGLDSRIAMLYAMKNKFEIGCSFCFSQSGYFDEKISRKIAGDYHLHYEFVPLDNGFFLDRIDTLAQISEGTTIYTGGIHVEHAIQNLKFKNFSLFHSGQIGDGVLGGFNSEPVKKPPNGYKIVINNQLLSKIENNMIDVMRNYEREEVFLLRNLAYNRTVLGAQVFQQKAYQTSPFMTKDFIRFAISLPEDWKYNHRFYFEWISKHCKEAEKYVWERTLMRPNAKWKVFFGDKIVKRSFVHFYNKILRSPEKTSMYPYQYYFDSSIYLQQYYTVYFNENIERLDAYPELQNDVIGLFSRKAFLYKCQAIHILSIFKMYF